MKRVIFATVAALMVTGSLGVVRIQARADQTASKSMSLGMVTIPRKVMADGKPLAAGSYTLRLAEAGSPVVGESPNSETWIEFLKGSNVEGRELATVLSKADLKEMKKPAAPGIVVLQGNEYLRVWVNHAGEGYLLHLVLSK